MKPRYSSNSKIFEKRGDPWLSQREGIESFGRNPEIENPDMDCFTRARKAVPKSRYIDPKPEKKGEDFQRRKVSLLRAITNRSNRQEFTAVRDAVHQFKPCPGCRKAICIARGICHR